MNILGKCQHLGWGSLGSGMLESSARERELGVLLGGRLDMTVPGSQEGHPCPEGHQAQLAKGEDCPALLWAGSASPCVLGAVLGTTI